MAAKITVIYLLYNAEKTVPALVNSIRAQRHPSYSRQEDWLEVIFMDDRSRDETLRVLDEALGQIGRPKNYWVEPNSENLGLARTLNKAFGLARSPYGLTCHCDCFFGTETYVATMLELMDSRPDAGSITGQPALASEGGGASQLPFAEKLNLVSNLMDIFPRKTGERLVPVGFAEGRCDVFRIEALRAVGFYDTALRVAGEDQLLAAKMRRKGYGVYQAPQVPYYLRASDEQDSVRKLMKHEFRFGKVHPFILLRNPDTSAGIIGSSAGGNRQARTLLRALQIASTLAYLWALVAIFAGLTWVAALSWVGLAFFGKALLFYRHIRAVRLKPLELFSLILYQPALDISYTLGLIQGLWLMVKGSADKPIT